MHKHKEGHNKRAKFCHFFNNKEFCPYDENGCMFQHEISPLCYFKENCINSLCQFKHKAESMEDKRSCDKCGFKAKGKKQLDVHIEFVHVNQTCTSFEKDFCCDYCGKAHDEIDDLIDHFGETSHNLEDDI